MILDFSTRGEVTIELVKYLDKMLKGLAKTYQNQPIRQQLHTYSRSEKMQRS
jgi:hypothetical protein